MSRPQYETELDLKNERLLRDRFERSFNVRTNKLPQRYYVDCAVTSVDSSVIIGIAEFKCRRTLRDQYPTYMMSLEKYQRGREMARGLSVPFYLIVHYGNGEVWWYDASQDDAVVTTWGGRTRLKRDADDEEPVVLIPNNYFKPLEEK